MSKSGVSGKASQSCPVMSDHERAAALKAIPGPGIWPIVGNALQMPGETTHLWMVEQAEKYGPIMRVKLFDIENIMLNTIEAVNEAFIERGTDGMAAKQTPRLQYVMGDDISSSSQSDPQYTVLRKTLEQGLDESMKLKETPGTQRQISVDIIEKYSKSKEFKVSELSREWASRFASSLIFGGKHGADDQNVKDYDDIEVILQALLGNPSGVILDLKPWLFEHKCIKSGVHKKLDTDSKKLTEIGQRLIRTFRANFDGKTTKCVMDRFLKRQYHEIRTEEELMVDDAKMISVMMDLSLGNHAAVTNTLNSALHLLIADTDLQRRLQDEIDSQFGTGHVIVDADRAKVPQVEAFILENMRYCPALPFLIPHAAERDTEVAGYKIPEGAALRVNFYNIAKNPKVYTEPNTFNIDRFLSDGKLVAPEHPARASLIPFGKGARYCPGKYFFNHYYFELMCYILQRYTIAPAGEIPATDPRDIPCALAPMGILHDTKAKLVKRS